MGTRRRSSRIRVQVAEELLDGALQHGGARGGLRVEKAHQVVRPALEQLAVLGRNSQHLGDDGHGQRHREVPDQVELPLPGQAREELVGEGLHPGPQLFDGPRRERLADQGAQPCVVWRVAPQHDGLLGSLRIDQPLANRQRAIARVGDKPAVVGREARVAQQQAAIGVTEEDPAVVSQKALQAVQTIDSSQWVAREA